jgi:hypothetical protein
MEVLCNDCPAGGVGIYNPGFWGMVGLQVNQMLVVHISMRNEQSHKNF